jgi:hypothetical protein
VNVQEVKQRLLERRAELKEQLEVVLPKVEKLEGEIKGNRETIARLEQRRDILARYGNKRIEIPNPTPTGPALPELGQFYAIELEPFRSIKTGKQLAAEVQVQIDDLLRTVQDLEREAQELLGRRTRGR